MASTVFDDVQPWPETKGRDPRFDNSPPLEERVMLEFEEELERDGVKARVQELLESAGRVPEKIEDDTIAGKVGDLCKLARDVEKRIADAREKHNRPLLNAQRALKGKADGIFAPLSTAIANVRSRLNAYMAEQARKADEERRRREEEARRIREEQERKAAETGAEPEPIVEVEPVKVAEPVARGDLGARVGTTTRWVSEVEDYKKAFTAVADNANVREAVDKAVAALVRSGARQIKGVRIFEETVASVR